MTATYFILLDLKTRNKSIDLLRNHKSHYLNSHSLNRHYESTTNFVSLTLLREKRQELTPQWHINHRPADLLLISQPYLSLTYHKDRNHKTPNKENIENSQSRYHDERTKSRVK